MEATTLHEGIISFLDANKVLYRVVKHEITKTSEDSARERGEPLGCGAKALVMRSSTKGTISFCVLVVPADCTINKKLAKKALGVKDLRFASADELATIVGVPSGAVPPFGEPFINLPLIADLTVGVRYPNVAFNAGSLTDSVIMAAEDWERLAQPRRINLCGVEEI